MYDKLRFALYGAIAAALLVLILWVKGCHPTPQNPWPKVPLATTDRLSLWRGPTEIVVQTHTDIKRRYVPPEGEAVVTVSNDNTVRVDVKNKGFCLRPGIGGFYDTQARIGFDLQVGYWNRFSLHVGVMAGFNHSRDGAVFVGSGYKLDRIGLPNTSLVLGVTHKKEPMLGLRVGF